MVVNHKVTFPEMSQVFVDLFNKAYRSNVRVKRQEQSSVSAFDFNEEPYLMIYFFAYKLGAFQKFTELTDDFKLTQESYIEPIDQATDMNSPMLTVPVSEPLGVVQVIYKFNTMFGADTVARIKYLDGCPFVTFNFGKTTKETLFRLAYELGSTQVLLSHEGKDFLPFNDYPYPPDNEFYTLEDGPT